MFMVLHVFIAFSLSLCQHITLQLHCALLSSLVLWEHKANDSTVLTEKLVLIIISRGALKYLLRLSQLIRDKADAMLLVD